jgi:serine/threonine-protein kinase RsbW
VGGIEQGMLGAERSPDVMRIQVMLALPRDAASVPLARHTVTAALECAGVTGDCVADVEIALSEACTNAYRHAQDGDDFEVLITIGDDSMTVDVLDRGVGLGERTPPTTMPSPSSDGGRGLALMAAFTDQAVFDSVTGDGVSVHLVKHLRWSADAPFRAPPPADSTRRGVRSSATTVPRQR